MTHIIGSPAQTTVTRDEQNGSESWVEEGEMLVQTPEKMQKHKHRPKSNVNLREIKPLNVYLATPLLVIGLITACMVLGPSLNALYIMHWRYRS